MCDKAVVITRTTCLEQIAAYNRDLYCTHTAVGGRVALEAPPLEANDSARVWLSRQSPLKRGLMKRIASGV